jgi:predicted XRE-type DNA-binding protein
LSTFSELWPKLKGNKKYREEFVAQHAKQAIPFQIAALLKQFKLTQTELATRAGVSQGVISRAADPSYGNLTINTLVRIAAGFDVAFVGRFVAFSELPKWFDRIHSESFTVPSFGQEDKAYEERAAVATERGQSPARTDFVLQQLLHTVKTWNEQQAMNVAEADQFLRPIQEMLTSREGIAMRQVAPKSEGNLVDFAEYKQRLATQSSVGSLAGQARPIADARSSIAATAFKVGS